jgi:antitoxin component YwqK of YwqJK toxin-antitoxin module
MARSSCADSNGYLLGAIVEYHANGIKKEEGEFRSGERLGIHREWYETGVLKKKTTYGDRGRVLMEEEFDEAGDLIDPWEETENGHHDDARLEFFGSSD